MKTSHYFWSSARGSNLPLGCCLLGILVLGSGWGSAQLTRVANTTLNLPAELPVATTFTTENALGGLTFTAPIDVASIPTVTNRLFVVERNTGIQMVNLDTMAKSTFMNLAAVRSLYTSSESGILSLAFHPNFNQNGYFYVFYSVTVSSQLTQRVARFQATGTAGNYNAATTADPATEQTIINQKDPAGNHNGGDMAFGPDGYLYFSTGDGGAQYDGNDNGRRIAKNFLGSVFRIDVDMKATSLAPNAHTDPDLGGSAISPNTYKVPPDNPFVALASGAGTASYNGYTFNKSAIRTEIFSVGYRNPFRMSFDPQTGRLFVGDVGQDNYEEVNIVPNGFNAGWSWREGLHAHTPNKEPKAVPSGFLGADPIYEFDHSNNGNGNDAVVYGSSIIGGVVYRGNRLSELYGKYLFNAYDTGHIVALTEGAGGAWTGVRLATDNNISGWGYDPRNNDALLVDHVTGTVKRLARSGTTGTAPPATLSAAGVFSNLGSMTPNAGIVGYEPNVPFWSDYAVKSRWFSIKNLTDKLTFSKNANWTLPTGMVWIKHFDIDTTRGNATTRKKLETRILVKTPSDVYGLSYKWRADQLDADLVAEDGLSEAIPSSSPAQTWRFPSRSECRTCHTPAGGFALSFNTRQLNKDHAFGAQTLNQIAALSSAGYFSTSVSGASTMPAFAKVTDTSASLEWRVRSYLAVNCVQCHQPGGAASGFWDARATTPTDMANLINGPLVNDGGSAANKWAVPGDTAHSMILKRQQGAGVNRMPPLGTNERDLVAEQLLTDWIMNALPTRENFAQWQTSNFGGTINPDNDFDGDGLTNRLEYLMNTNPKSVTTPYQPTAVVAPNTFSLSFLNPANRSAQVETSTDFGTWTLWDVPGNGPLFPAIQQTRTVTGPTSGARSFYRVKLSEP